MATLSLSNYMDPNDQSGPSRIGSHQIPYYQRGDAQVNNTWEEFLDSPLPSGGTIL